MSDAAGFKIGEQVYEFPQRFRMGDSILVEEVTGVSFEEFAERLDEVNEAIERGEKIADLKVLVGMMGVAVWQANPRWKRDRVVAFVNQIDMEMFESIGGDDGPPTQGAGAPANPSPDSSNESTSTQEPSEEKDLV